MPESVPGTGMQSPMLPHGLSSACSRQQTVFSQTVPSTGLVGKTIPVLFLLSGLKVLVYFGD